MSNKKNINTPKRLGLALVTPLLLILGSCGGSGDQGSSDPVAVDIPIAYVDRPLYTDEDINNDIDPEPVLVNIQNPREFNGGARLILRASNTRSGEIRDITDKIIDKMSRQSELIDIKDLSPSPSGKKFVFAAMAVPLEIQDEDEEKWDIWEYDLANDTVNRLMTSGTFAQEAHDISPIYLADDTTIVFASTRQDSDFQILVAESNNGANKFAFFSLTESGDEINNELGIGAKFNLHTLNTETQIVKQITFNRSHDLQPTLLMNGRVAFLRWDNHPNGDERQSIYSINPDGSDLSPLYGYHSQDVVDSSNGNAETTFFDLAATVDGRLLAIIKQQDNSIYPDFSNNSAMVTEATNPFLGGELVSINYQQFTDIAQPSMNHLDAQGLGQTSLLGTNIDISNAISQDGYVNSAYPVNDGSGKVIYSRTPCRAREENSTEILRCPDNIGREGIVEADPYYSLWQFDASKGTKALVQATEEGRMITDVITLREVQYPEKIDPLIPTSLTGVVHIESIYDLDGELANTPNGASISELSLPSDDANSPFRQRSARFIRVLKAVSEPTEDAYDFDDGIASGVSNNEGYVEILGYAPIEPDGSVAIKVPANVAFKFDITDQNGRRLGNFGRHLNWLSVVPGEVMHCTGCHSANSTYPHGRRDAEAPSVNLGAASDGVFPNTSLLTAAGWDMATAFAARNTIITEDTNDAERYASARDLLPDIIYEDDLFNTSENIPPLRYAAAEPISADLLEFNVPAPPTSNGCIFDWNVNCRIIINYETNIQPIWEVDRISGANNYQCISCHSSNGNTRIPAGFLELSDEPVNNLALSYGELLTENNVTIGANLVYRYRTDADTGLQLFLQELDDKGTIDTLDDELVDVLDPAGQRIPLVDVLSAAEQDDAIANNQTLLIQAVDTDGAFVFIMNSNGTLNDTNDDTVALDGTDQIPSLVSYNGPIGAIDRRMIAGNAAASRFFTVMNSREGSFNHSRLNQDDINDTTPLMNEHELRLITEWLDIGAQYYNNPFDAPLDN